MSNRSRFSAQLSMERLISWSGNDTSGTSDTDQEAEGATPAPPLRPVVMRASRAWRLAPSPDIAHHKAGEEEGAAANGG